ncbi:MAG: DUF6113 family protein [Nocardioidaceae bacterium]
MTVVRHTLALLLGAATGLAAVLVHRMAVQRLPFGLVLAVAATLATAWMLRRSAFPRLAMSYGVGWWLVFGLVLAGRPEGDYAIAADVDGFVLIGTAFAVVFLAVTALTARPPDVRRTGK